MTNSNNPIIDEKLLYRRQFFLGPKFINQFPDWEKIKIGKKLFLTSHPDLQVTRAKNGKHELILLGFMFDSEEYQSSNEKIINRILINSQTFEQIVQSTFRYAGRWVLIYTDGNKEKLLHDPGGLKQVFFTSHNSSTWCSAQPHIIAELLGKNKRQDKRLDSFLNCSAFENNERNLIGEDTLFEDVKHLFPNHYLDLNTCQQVRYWPNEKLANLPIDNIVNEASKILSELIKAANFRHKIEQTITAGWDTRVLLAASHQIKDKCSYFVQQLPNMNVDHDDILIPRQIARDFKLNFKVIDCSEYSDEIEQINSKNVFMAQSERKKYQYFNYFKYFHNKMIISGNVSPLVKELYPSIDAINANNLARLLFYHNEKYAIEAIDKWLEKALPISQNYDLSIEKLFYWEMRFGSWASMYYSELDIAVEEFSPFNCRNLLNLLLNAPAELRKKPNQYLYQKIIEKLWPELLDYPVNPDSLNKSTSKNSLIITKIMPILKKLRLYKSVRYFYRKFI